MGVSITFLFLKMVLNSLLGAPFSEHLTEPHIHVQSVKACAVLELLKWKFGCLVQKSWKKAAVGKILFVDPDRYETIYDRFLQKFLLFKKYIIHLLTESLWEMSGIKSNLWHWMLSKLSEAHHVNKINNKLRKKWIDREDTVENIWADQFAWGHWIYERISLKNNPFKANRNVVNNKSRVIHSMQFLVLLNV